jgi:hypothetical protein
VAKGQKRSNRETKKPKKTPAEKAKSGVAPSFTAPASSRIGTKKKN